MSTFLSKNRARTKKIGENLARKILQNKPRRKKALVLGLIGDLGGGKTTFLQGFARGLGIKERILSPTFVIMKKFGLPDCLIAQLVNFYHIDCYRIQEPKEVLALGWEGIIKNPQNIVAVEWADKIKKLLPKDKIMIRFEVIGKNRRKIIVSG
jgi:tRNA threonylcarbamoyladenosine biosynthesis protein TsaE